MKTYFCFLGTDHRKNLLEDRAFLLLLQRAVLLGLKEEGYLTQTQQRLAEEILLRQFRPGQWE